MGLGNFHPIDLRFDSIFEANNALGGGITYANGATVTAWNDLMGANNFTAAYTADPTYVTNAFNGKDAINFVNTSSQGLSTSATTNNNYFGDMTIYAIAATSDNTLAHQPLLDKGTNNGWYVGINAAQIEWRCNNTYYQPTSTFISNNSFFTCCFQWSPTGPTLNAWFENQQVITNVTTITPTNAFNNMSIGNDNGVTNRKLHGQQIAIYWAKRIIAAWERGLMDMFTSVQIGQST
jgi:hypothetical protein